MKFNYIQDSSRLHIHVLHQILGQNRRERHSTEEETIYTQRKYRSTAGDYRGKRSIKSSTHPNALTARSIDVSDSKIHIN